MFTTLTDKPIYPNLYVIMVSPPGIGKSVAITEAKELVSGMRGFTMAPDVVTIEKLYDIMEASHKAELTDEGMIEQSSVAAFADEMSILIKKGDTVAMAALSKIYDCAKTFDKGTRHVSSNHIVKPSLTLIGGVTPIWLKENFTDDAFETGFPSRCILVYDDFQKKYNLFNPAPIRPELQIELKHDARRIYEMKGEFKWEPKAAEEFQKWVDEGLPPVIKDPKFIHYNRRRLLQVTKLSMVVAASFRQDLIIRLSDFMQARELLLDVEAVMHLAAAGMGSNPYKYHMDIVYAFIRAGCANGNGVDEHRVRQKLARDVPLHFIEPMLTSMVEMRMLQEDPGTEAPNRIFYPGQQLYLEQES